MAMVPVSVRAGEERHQAGNLVSAMLVPLATDEPDRPAAAAHPRLLARLEGGALGGGARTRWAPRSAALRARGLGASSTAGSTSPSATARCSTSWSPTCRGLPPLCIAGATLLAHFGSAPLFDGLGLIVTVMSYAGTVSFGVTADHAAMSDAAGFADRLTAAADELAA